MKCTSIVNAMFETKVSQRPCRFSFIQVMILCEGLAKGQLDNVLPHPKSFFSPGLVGVWKGWIAITEWVSLIFASLTKGYFSVINYLFTITGQLHYSRWDRVVCLGPEGSTESMCSMYKVSWATLTASVKKHRWQDCWYWSDTFLLPNHSCGLDMPLCQSLSRHYWSNTGLVLDITELVMSKDRMECTWYLWH